MAAAVGLCGGRALAAQGASPEVLRDENYCMGCHAAGAHAENAPIVGIDTLHLSSHSTVTCVDCHDDIKAVPHTKPVKAANCGQCHSEEGQAELVVKPGKTPAALGTHGSLRQQKMPGIPTCVQCHGAHDVFPPTEPKSRLHRSRIATTCASCHPQVASEYLKSIHGQALSRGNADVPVCDTCHPEHPRTSRQGIAQKGVVATCTACHEDPGLQQRYAIPANRLSSYMGSYHGAAAELGDSRTANCASCHGKHLILPSADSRSSVNPANLPRTCGQCHPGAGINFAGGKIHLQPSAKQDRVVFFVRIGYILFIVGLMSSFVGYIGLDLTARARGKIGKGRAHPEDEPQFERLTLNQRIQHWCLITTFSTLMISGLPLASPGSSVSRSVVMFLGGMGARAIIHRTAAIALILLVVYHLLYVLFSRKGYWEFQQLLPGLLDARDIAITLGFYLGLTPVRARSGRYNFIEKFEYLAVGWGSVVMITTGALLWAPQISLAFLPKWVMDVAFIIHSWEAILAFLAIIIWHMYNVHGNPSVFPMSRVWLTGTIGLGEFEENHPLEYEQYLRDRGAGPRPATGGAPAPSAQHEGDQA
jgi:cytochrome b subunit of formate dehydrogenase